MLGFELTTSALPAELVPVFAFFPAVALILAVTGCGGRTPLDASDRATMG